VVFVPWSVTIPASEENNKLTAELLGEELPGILNWIVEGAKAYIERGLSATPAIAAITDSLLSSRNDLERWVESCVEHGPGFAVQSSVLYENFRAWSKGQDVSEPLSIRDWSQRLELEMGFDKGKGNGGLQTWIGIRIREQKPDGNCSKQVDEPVRSKPQVTYVMPKYGTDATAVSSGYVTPTELQRMPGGGQLA
jgi:phage/plasmid-associated DNA primase